MTRNEIKAELIRMRQYFIHHDIQAGECVGWTRLKAAFGVGEVTAIDAEWLRLFDAGKIPKGNEHEGTAETTTSVADLVPGQAG